MTTQEKIQFVDKEYRYSGLGYQLVLTPQDEVTPALDFYIDALVYTDNVYDVDRWANLNTYFGYEIPYEVASEIETELSFDALDVGVDDKPEIEAISKAKGWNLDFSKWPDKEPKYYEYFGRRLI